MKAKLIIYHLFFIIVISGCEKPVQDNIIEPENLVGDYCGSYFESPNGIAILAVCNITKSENSEEFILNNFAYTNLSVKFKMIDDSIAIPDSIYITDNVAFESCGNQLKRQISGSGLYNINNQKIIINYSINEYCASTDNLMYTSKGCIIIKKKNKINYIGTFYGIEKDSNIILNVSKYIGDTSYIFTLMTLNQDHYLFNNSFIGQNNQCHIDIMEGRCIDKETNDTLIINGFANYEYYDYSQNNEIFYLSLWKVHQNDSNVWYSPYYQFKGIKN